MFDVTKVRQDFPILSVKIYNKPLVYLDNAASSQKPNAVIQAISNYYSNCHSNIHRAFHYLGDNATLMYEQARSKVTNYINATGADEIIFTRGTTESINLVASILEHADFFRKSDEIILTVAEHHSNIV
ncbi:MAG: aminotransferase class V-fold PLP-dependent enzyme, partial [Gammaproteobacteria bacterium]|nr:aminotransferase class V-fold PLP-dependent enzyme [Gammaproteobacteria bacterium]